MEDDEDDLYTASETPATAQSQTVHNGNVQPELKPEIYKNDQEEGEEDGEEADQDVDSVCSREASLCTDRGLFMIRT